MTTLQVFVKRCSEATGWMEVDHGGSVTAHIPVRSHENSITIQKKFARWKVELSRGRPGLGKPYLMRLTNENKGDKIKISIVPQQDFLRTFLNDCKFKSVQHFTLVGPNITTRGKQIDKTASGMKLELESYGTLRISSHPLQVKEVSAIVVPKADNTSDSDETQLLIFAEN